MDLTDDMLGAPPDDSGRRTRGSDIQFLRERINNHLRQRRLTPLIPANPENWSVARKSEFLDLAAFRFNWDEGGLAGTWWDMDGNDLRQEDGKKENPNQTPNQEVWNRITPEYPNLFTQSA